MADPEPDRRLEHLIGVATSIVAPLTLLSALLFYFGYAFSQARYAYFGLDVDTIGLSTQDFVMRSPEPLLTPLLVLILLGVASAAAHALVRRRIDAAGPESELPHRVTRIAVGIGAPLLLAGVLLLFAYAPVSGWAYYALVTPLLLAAGAGLAGYGLWLRTSLTAAARLRPAVFALGLVVATGIFWATATFAQWSGLGAAHDDARHLDQFPGVILDTTEQLYLTEPGVKPSTLAVVPGQTFRYRYRNLRLLIQGNDRLFLVPEHWSASDSTLVVPLNGSVRVQFRFVSSPPD